MMQNEIVDTEAGLPNGIARLIARLQGGGELPVYTVPSARRLRWGNDDLTAQVTRVYASGQKILVDLVKEGFDPGILTDGGWGGQKFGQEIMADLQSGATLHAKFAYMRESQMRSGEAGFTTRSQLELRDWAITPGSPVRYWVGATNIPANFNSGVGNLEIRCKYGKSGGSMSRSHLCLSGTAADYYLIHTQAKAWHILVDKADGALDRAILHHDLMLMSFCLGGWLSVDQLVGLDSEGSPVGACGLSLAGAEVPTWQAPTPTSPTPWFVAMFVALAAWTVRKGRDPVMFGLQKYLHSLAGAPLETLYYEIMSGIEGLSRMILSQKDEYIDSSFEKIRTALLSSECLCQDHEALDSTKMPELFGKLLRPPKSFLLSMALTELGLPADANWLEEMDYFQFEHGDGFLIDESSDQPRNYEIGKVRERLSTMRQMLVALIGRLCEYRGPIGEPDPSWWSVKKADYASPPLRTVSTEMDEVEMVAWPHFEKPTIAGNPLLAGLARFAARLEASTNGAVVALLQPVPVEGQDNPLLEFKFILRNAPSNQVVLFTVSGTAETLQVSGWSEDLAEIQTEADLGALCESVAKSPRVRRQIEDMLILADELRQFGNDN